MESAIITYIKNDDGKLTGMLVNGVNITVQLQAVFLQLNVIFTHQGNATFPANYKVNPHYSLGQSATLIALTVTQNQDETHTHVLAFVLAGLGAVLFMIATFAGVKLYRKRKAENANNDVAIMENSEAAEQLTA